MAAALPEDPVGSLLSALECPVCFEYVQPPVQQCMNGHCICKQCLEQDLRECPVCKVRMETPARSLIADKFVSNVMFPCKFTNEGCHQKQSLHDIVEHHKVCRFFIPCNIDSCAWRGPLSTLMDHITENHNRSASFEEYTTLIFNLPLMPAQHVTVIAAHEKVFRCYFTFDTEENKLYGSVRYLGPFTDESSFEYQIEFWSPVGDYRLVFQQITSEDTDYHADADRMCVDGNMLQVFYVDRSDKLLTCSVRIVKN